MKFSLFLKMIPAFLLVTGPVYAVESVEVVQSVPLETTLGVPGVRQTQEVWLEMVHGAHSTIDLEQFYVSEQTGEALTPVIAAIQEAAKRGVQVRLLVDSKFLSNYPETVRLLGGQAHIEARSIDYSRWGGIQHAKFFVVDGQQTFVGSQNFDWRAISHIHEIGLKVNDSQVAATVETVFNQDWGQSASLTATPQVPPSSFALGALVPGFAFLTEKQTHLADPISLVTVDSTPQVNNPAGVKWSADALIELMAAAQHNLRIQVYEYGIRGSHGNWTLLDDAIRAAAARGVKVQLLVDAVSLHAGRNELSSLAKVPGIEVCSVQVPAWSGGPVEFGRLVHSKYMVVDGTAAWVGSANWIEGYFLNTRNVGLVVKSSATAETLNQIFAQVWGSAYTTVLR